jgi:DNA-binding MarR family transcriptional regulator
LQTLSVAKEATKRAEIVADEVRQLLGALSRRLRAESASIELSSSENLVLRRLHEHGPSTTAALARAEYVKPQSMGATLAALEEEGLVARTVDETDARCRTVTLTEAGRLRLMDGRQARQNWLARAVHEKLDADEQRSLLASLELLRRVIGP